MAGRNQPRFPLTVIGAQNDLRVNDPVTVGVFFNIGLRRRLFIIYLDNDLVVDTEYPNLSRFDGAALLYKYDLTVGVDIKKW